MDLHQVGRQKWVFTSRLKIVIAEILPMHLPLILLDDLLLQELLGVGTQSGEVVACCITSVGLLPILLVLLRNDSIIEVVICHGHHMHLRLRLLRTLERG